MKKYKCDYHYVDSLVNRYTEAGGYAIQISEGSLASGERILYDSSGELKCYYIYEIPLNAWSSYQAVQAYKDWEKFPKKFKKQIEAHNVHRTA